MARTNLRINAYGVDGAELHVGQWVEIAWNDSPNDIALVIGMDEHPKTYKGDRSMQVLVKDSKGTWRQQQPSVDHSQVVRIIPYELSIRSCN